MAHLTFGGPAMLAVMALSNNTRRGEYDEYRSQPDILTIILLRRHIFTCEKFAQRNGAKKTNVRIKWVKIYKKNWKMKKS